MLKVSKGARAWYPGGSYAYVISNIRIIGIILESINLKKFITLVTLE